jgi:hypothetical protein
MLPEVYDTTLRCKVIVVYASSTVRQALKLQCHLWDYEMVVL